MGAGAFARVRYNAASQVRRAINLRATLSAAGSPFGDNSPKLQLGKSSVTTFRAALALPLLRNTLTGSPDARAAIRCCLATGAVFDIPVCSSR
jgi:hypothetical protein